MTTPVRFLFRTTAIKKIVSKEREGLEGGKKKRRKKETKK